jgi:hypothetical protein
VNGGCFLHRSSRIVLGATLLLSWGCVHRIQVAPSPLAVSSITIGQSVQVILPFLVLIGADHRKGITLLEWPAQDLRSGAIAYIQSRQTFTSVSDTPADLTLTVKAWLTMRSSSNYRYTLRLESALGPSGQLPIKSYLVEKEAIGSSVRWITASDQTPIAETVQAALDDLLTQIEADHLLYRNGQR